MSEVPFGFTVGRRWYAACGTCGSTIRMNKPLLGSLHFCLTAQERVTKRVFDQMRAEQEASTWRYSGPFSGILPESGRRRV